MSPETAQKILTVIRHPAYQTASNAMLGATVGSFAGSLMYKDEFEKLKEIMASKDNVINSKEYVAKYNPNLGVVSTRADVDKNKGLNWLDKIILKRAIPEGDEPWTNAFYSSADENSAVVVPKKVNQYILGHELGHHEDLKGKSPGFFDTGMIGLLTGKVSDMERKAWEKSPIEIDEEGKRVKDLALGSYENLQKYVRIGFGLGVATGAMKAFGPKVLDMIRGNIR